MPKADDFWCVFCHQRPYKVYSVGILLVRVCQDCLAKTIEARLKAEHKWPERTVLLDEPV